MQRSNSHRVLRPNHRGFDPALAVCAAALACAVSTCSADLFLLPTANHTLYDRGQEEKFFVGTEGKPWMSGTFGCVRTEGRQMHEGLDIRCLQRDRRGEPIDPVMASADGAVAYINNRPSLSNYGNYIVLRHQIEGLDICTLYAHLSEIRPGVRVGQFVKAGEQIATMGHSSNTRQRITLERAHVHFEIDLVLNDRYAAWHRSFLGSERNDHGDWNGKNLVGIDPRAVLLWQHQQGAKFSLLNFLRNEPELCRVLVQGNRFSWLKRNSTLTRPNPLAEKDGVWGYEIILDFNGVPIGLTPRAASEVKIKAKAQVISVNEPEQQRNPCRKLVTKRGSRWELTSHGQELLNLLIY